MINRSLILVVDDDRAVRDSIRALLESAGYAVKCYDSAKSLLSDDLSKGSCLIVDIRMPGMDGIELQEELTRRGIAAPVIIVTGHGDVPLAVRAMKAGAADFFEKPFDDETIMRSLRRALEMGALTRINADEVQAARQMLELLTPRERSVLEQIVAGRSNKVSAYELGISPRTIEIHRAHIMNKTKAGSLADLVRLWLASESTFTRSHQ